MPIAIFFIGMWGPTPFGQGDPPSAYDGNDQYGFPIRYRTESSGMWCDDGPCGGESSSPIVLGLDLLLGAGALSVGWLLGGATARSLGAG